MFKKLGELLKLVLLKNKLPSVIDVSKGFPDKLRKIYVGEFCWLCDENGIAWESFNIAQ